MKQSKKRKERKDGTNKGNKKMKQKSINYWKRRVERIAKWEK